MDLRNKIIYVFVAIIFLIGAFLFIPGIYTDLLWFGSLGLSEVFITILNTKLIAGITSAFFCFAVLFFNWLIIQRVLTKQEINIQITIKKMMPSILAFFALIVGFAFSSQWNTILKFFNATVFNVFDPVFGNDISFYVFSLPFYQSIIGLLLGITILSFFISLLFYFSYSQSFRFPNFQNIEQNFFKNMGKDFKGKEKIHLCALAGIFFVLLSIWIWLSRYSILFSDAGAVFGAAYIFIFFSLSLLTILSFLLGIIGLLFFSEWKIRNLKYPFIAIGVIIFILLFGSIIGFAVQQFVVEPDEYNMEKPYIERNINYTLQAFDLNTIEEIPFEPNYNMSYQELKENNVTLNNIRLWDYRALKDTYAQLQLIRSYYDFNDVDIDRYYVTENETQKYFQVMLSPRELNQEDLAEKAKTWVNQHLVYTHGYGVALSPVNRKTQEGFPELWIKDIPPKTEKGLTIDRPEIYYGEKTNNFVIVNSKTEEFDYPMGGENVYTTYNGSGGVGLSGFSKLAFALRFGSIQILVSGSVTDESKIMLHRNIHDRVEEIAPFLTFDSDPYMISSKGNLYWIIDAYTTTNSFPYSERYGEERTNYMRNAVKVVVNAYSGNVSFYIIDNEPLISTYQKMFPDLFSDFSEMPDELKNHIRYPEDLFTIQAEVYSTYHMTDSRVFYNREDQWKIPNELYSGNTIKMEPYYVLINLPGTNSEPNFIMMTPFTPKGKDNMIGWMGAKSNPSDYGEKVIYQFSKQELIYGPIQIESRIDQDTEISQRMTLWSQSGSRVIRGNLLVIPIEQSLLYVEPVYLRASGASSIPQLKRVIVAYGDRVAMRNDLNTSLQAVFGEQINETIPDEEPIEGDLQELINQAIDLYAEAESLLMQGDFSGYAEKIEQLGDVLNQINNLQENQSGS